MDAEQKRRILDQAHANIARLSEMKIRLPTPLFDDDAASPSHDPVRRGWPEGRPPSLDVPPQTDWAAIEQYVEGRIDMERAFMLAVVSEALGEALVEAREAHQKELAAEREAHRAELVELRGALTRMEGAVHKLAAFEAKTIVDLPALPLRRNDVN